jgi:glucose-6-phosphate isomerase
MLKVEYNNFDSSEYNKSSVLATDSAKIISGSINNDEPYYKIFLMDYARKMAQDCRAQAEDIKSKFLDLIVIGMGGAVLNPESALELCNSKKSNVRIHFLHNTDPLYLQNLLDKVSLKDCAIVAISNSGNTLETNSLVGVMISEYKKAGIKDLGRNFYVITNLKSGGLHGIAKRIDATIIEHQSQISGRYSGLSNVTSFVAQIAGIDMESFFDGADEVINEYMNQGADSSPVKAAISIRSSGLKMMVNIGYLQSFGPYLEWYSQIIAESLGKDGDGITPIRGLGPNDQHSMMQLYLDAQKDKIYSLFYVDKINELSNDFITSDLPELSYIANKKLIDINTANFKATKHALIKRGLPTRTIHISDLSAKSIGSLVAHSMLEIITLGHMMNINVFNQPGVELIKSESKRLI